MTILKGDKTKNTLIGGVDNDRLYGYGDNDILSGGAGNDFLFGGNGTDTLNGDDGNDKLNGGNGADILNGGTGNDILFGGLGLDKLYGEDGNDTLQISDFNGDRIDGGTGIDSLQILAEKKTIDLRHAPNLKNIEVIRLGDSHSTLIVDHQSIINLSDDSNTLKVDARGDNTLKMDSGWTDMGINGNYHIFTKGAAELQVNSVITDIEILPTPYTISNVATANGVIGIFNSGIQEITIDFGGKEYWAAELGDRLETIDLTGFGVEDKFIINHNDGSVKNGPNYHYDYRKSYINSGVYRHWKSGPPSSTYDARSAKIDRVSWQKGANTAKLISSGTSWTGLSGVFGSIKIIGLPTHLPDSQFIFI